MDDILDKIKDDGAAATTIEELRESFADLCEYVARLESRISDAERRPNIIDADARKLHTIRLDDENS